MQRTLRQNSAIHLYCELLALALDAAGHDMRECIRVPIQPTAENVKECMFKTVMTALYPDKKSTTELEKHEVTRVYENVNRITSERFGISVEFPSEETHGKKNGL